MFKPDSKYRLHFLIVMFVLLVIVSTMRFYSFSEKKDGMEMIGGIVFGIMAIVYAGDLYGVIKNKKSINRGA